MINVERVDFGAWLKDGNAQSNSREFLFRSVVTINLATSNFRVFARNGNFIIIFFN